MSIFFVCLFFVFLNVKNPFVNLPQTDKKTPSASPVSVRYVWSRHCWRRRRLWRWAASGAMTWKDRRREKWLWVKKKTLVKPEVLVDFSFYHWVFLGERSGEVLGITVVVLVLWLLLCGCCCYGCGYGYGCFGCVCGCLLWLLLRLLWLLLWL